MSGRVLVGTSSWADPGFVKDWYPPRMPAKERLPWYAQRFEAVELNSSFYAVPDRNVVRGWAEATPQGFVFDVKVHRALSRHAAPLDSLPPDLREGARTNDRGRVLLDPELETALARRLVEALAPHRVAVELRHRGWVSEKRLDRTLGWFSERGAAFVCVDAPPGDHVPIMPSDLDAVTRDDLAYLRLHGRNAEGYLRGKSVAERFAWRYDDDELEEIAGRVHAMAEQAREVHVAFNNNRGDDAPTAAQRFRALLGQAPAGEEQLRL